VIDDTELENIQSIAKFVKDQVAAGEYPIAGYLWGQTLDLVREYSNGIDLYNFLVFHAQDLSSDKRTLLANGEYFTVKFIRFALELRQSDQHYIIHGLPF